MKRKKFLALALASAVLTVSLTACTPLDAAELLYDWLFGGGSSNASRGNGTGLVESETLEESIIQWFGLPSANRQKDVAEPILQEAAKSFDPESWYKGNGELNGTARAALDTIVQKKLTMNGSSKFAYVDVWEVQPRQTDFNPSTGRKLYYDLLTLDEDSPDTPTHSSFEMSYGVLKAWMDGKGTFDLYASVFQKNGETYAAMVIIWQRS